MHIFSPAYTCAIAILESLFTEEIGPWRNLTGGCIRHCLIQWKKLLHQLEKEGPVLNLGFQASAVVSSELCVNGC